MTDEQRRFEDKKPECQVSELRIDIVRLQERLEASDRALELSREDFKAWKLVNNEWRQENLDQRSQYMTIEKCNSLISIEASLRGALEGRVRVMEDAWKISTGKQSAINSTWVFITFIITTGLTIIALTLKFYWGK